MTYAVLSEQMKPEQRLLLDEMLEEPYLEDFPPGLERAREEARRKARELGIDDGRGARDAFRLPTKGPQG